MNGSVCMSTAAYSARHPGRVGDVGIGALLEQHRRHVVVAVDDREDHRGGAVGILRCRDWRRPRPARAPPRARPRGPRTSAPSWRRPEAWSGRRPCARRSSSCPRGRPWRRPRAAAARRRHGSRAAAHISAVSPNQLSWAFGSAPRASSIRIASTLPVRAAVISTVSPSAVAPLASAPACSSASIIARIAVLGRQLERRACRSGWRRGSAPACSSARTSRRIVHAHRPVQRRRAVGFRLAGQGALLLEQRSAPPGCPGS